MKKPDVRIGDQLCRLSIISVSILQQINDVPAARIEIALSVSASNAARDREMLEIEGYCLGKNISIHLAGIPIFAGDIIRKKLRLQTTGGTMLIEARHSLHRLLTPPRCQLYRQKCDADILSSILNKAGVEPTIQSTQMSQLHSQMVQFRSSNWNFLRSRLFSTNSWMLPDPASNRVVIVPMLTPGSKPRLLDRQGGRDDPSIYEIDINFSENSTTDSFELQGWDVAAQGLSRSQKSNPNVFAPWISSSTHKAGNRPERIWSQAFSYLPEVTLGPLAQSCFNHRQLTAVQGCVKMSGTLDFRCGERVTLNNFGGGIDGTAILTGVCQRFNASDGWRTELLFGLPAGLTEIGPKIQGLHIAIVAEFNEDPQHMNRIPVILPEFATGNEIIFARQGLPYASNEGGFCFYPEPGDEVIVGFTEDDPRFPIILGAMYNSRRVAPIKPTAANAQKAICFKNEEGIAQIIFDRTAGHVSVSHGNNNIIIGRSPKDSASIKDGLHLEAKNISQDTEEELRLTASSVEIVGGRINLKKSIVSRDVNGE